MMKVHTKFSEVPRLITLLEPQSRFRDKLLGIRVACPQNGTPVLKGLIYISRPKTDGFSEKIITSRRNIVERATIINSR